MAVPITVAYGDGIGPEIMEAVLFILKESHADIAVESAEIGSALYQRDWPCGISPSSWASIERTKILLKAPTLTPQGGGHKSLNVALRKNLGLYANIRPCVSYSPVVPSVHPNLDIVVVRENEEDTYCGVEYRLSNDAYECAKIATRFSSERLCEHAFAFAKNHNRKKVTCLVKDNIMKMTDGTFRKAFDKVAAMYPEIKSDRYIVDIGMAKVAVNPEDFDVVVTTNLYGDILSDVVSLASGSIGLSGSANIGDNYSMFEAVHGSAPDIAGQNLANPSGLLNAAIQMLVHIGQVDKAKIISNALLKTLEDGTHTADIYNAKTSSSKASTTDFARAIVDNLGASPTTLRGISINENYVKAAAHRYTASLSSIETAGIDITLRWDASASLAELVDSLSAAETPMKLRMIYAKGMELWPACPHAYPYTDLLSCRFYCNEGIGATSHLGPMLMFLEGLGLDVVKTVKLCSYDNEVGFFAP
ncbi:MAG: isocitrate dehydrogenase [Aaplasma endosymbiont of Hyalomma asiaticum]